MLNKIIGLADQRAVKSMIDSFNPDDLFEQCQMKAIKQIICAFGNRIFAKEDMLSKIYNRPDIMRLMIDSLEEVANDMKKTLKSFEDYIK